MIGRYEPRRSCLGSMTVVIEGSELPGLMCQPEADGPEHENVHVALLTKEKDRPSLSVPGKPWLAAEPVPGNAPEARWELDVLVRSAAARISDERRWPRSCRRAA